MSERIITLVTVIAALAITNGLISIWFFLIPVVGWMIILVKEIKARAR